MNDFLLCRYHWLYGTRTAFDEGARLHARDEGRPDLPKYARASLTSSTDELNRRRARSGYCYYEFALRVKVCKKIGGLRSTISSVSHRSVAKQNSLYRSTKPVGLSTSKQTSARFERRGHCRAAVTSPIAFEFQVTTRAIGPQRSPAVPSPFLFGFEDPNLAEHCGQGRARAGRRERAWSVRVGRCHCRLRHITKIFLVLEHK